MTGMPPIHTRVTAVREEVLQLALLERPPAVVVDSPPGAGKTDLVEAVAAVGVLDQDMRLAVTTPKFEQGVDLLTRLRADYNDMPIAFVHSSRRDVPTEIAADPGIITMTDTANLPNGPMVCVTTVAKLVTEVRNLDVGVFDLIISDEAYQVAWKDVLACLHLAGTVLLVGDPGQLSPIVRGDLARYEASRSKGHWAAPRELLRLHPDLPNLQLPATFRFSQDTVDFVQPAFYPDLVFESAVTIGARQLGLSTAGIGGPVDRALDLVVAGAGLVAIVLPARDIDEDHVDEELAELAVDVIERLSDRGAGWVGRQPAEALAENDIGYIDAHVASNAEVTRRLRTRGFSPDLTATTPEIWQGLQRPVMVTKHTLSGLSRLDPFALEPGRLSVMTSRHQLTNIIVSRDGVGSALEQHLHDCSERPSGSEDRTWNGWRAHQQLWSRLESAGRIVRV